MHSLFRKKSAAYAKTYVNLKLAIASGGKGEKWIEFLLSLYKNVIFF